MYLVSIDPGVHRCGVAVFKAGVLIAATLVNEPNDQWLSVAGAVQDYIIKVAPDVEFDGAIEIPQVYRFSKGDPNDLIDLTAVAGAIVGTLGGKWIAYKPREWKKQVDKMMMVERIKSRLTNEEHARMTLPRAKSLAHNVWDGVGIGLHCLGRL